MRTFLCLAALVLAGSAAATSAGGPTRGQVPASADVPGYTRTQVTVVHDRATWSQAVRLFTPPLLRHLGFVDAAIGMFQATAASRRSQTSATASVVRFTTASGARRYLAAIVAATPSRYVRFRVPRIPGAHGFSNAVQAGGTHDVFFTMGAFVYDLTLFTVDPTAPPSTADAAAAAARWYRRIRR